MSTAEPNLVAPVVLSTASSHYGEWPGLRVRIGDAIISNGQSDWFLLAAFQTVDLKMRKRLVLLQALAVLIATFQYGMRAAGQDEGGYSNRILSNPCLTARYVS